MSSSVASAISGQPAAMEPLAARPQDRVPPCSRTRTPRAHAITVPLAQGTKTLDAPGKPKARYQRARASKQIAPQRMSGQPHLGLREPVTDHCSVASDTSGQPHSHGTVSGPPAGSSAAVPTHNRRPPGVDMRYSVVCQDRLPRSNLRTRLPRSIVPRHRSREHRRKGIVPRPPCKQHAYTS